VLYFQDTKARAYNDKWAITPYGEIKESSVVGYGGAAETVIEFEKYTYWQRLQKFLDENNLISNYKRNDSFFGPVAVVAVLTLAALVVILASLLVILKLNKHVLMRAFVALFSNIESLRM